MPENETKPTITVKVKIKKIFKVGGTFLRVFLKKCFKT